jgi:hypothetical protein
MLKQSPLSFVAQLSPLCCTEVHTDNRPPPSVLSGRVSRSSSGDRKVPWLRKSSILWIWQHDKRTDDYKIILILCNKIDEK